MSPHVWWYVARSGGIVSYVLLAASVIWGLAMTTRVLGKRPKNAWLLDLHRFLGGAALVFIVIHVVAIMLDSYVHFGLLDVLVPMHGTWHPAAVAWGIVGIYLLLAVEITSLLRSRLPKRLWRNIHYLSFPVFALASLHALTAGTDRHSSLFYYGVIGAISAVVGLTALRVYQATDDNAARLEPAPTRAASSTGRRDVAVMPTEPPVAEPAVALGNLYAAPKVPAPRASRPRR
jgi:DMSO/TMAO reductase YedYZ heme-binding membrane subunit